MKHGLAIKNCLDCHFSRSKWGNPNPKLIFLPEKVLSYKSFFYYYYLYVVKLTVLLLIPFYNNPSLVTLSLWTFFVLVTKTQF